MRHHGQYNIQNTSRAVAIQSLIYGFFFFKTYVWLMIGPIVDLAIPKSDYGSQFWMAFHSAFWAKSSFGPKAFLTFSSFFDHAMFGFIEFASKSRCGGPFGRRSLEPSWKTIYQTRLVVVALLPQKYLPSSDGNDLNSMTPLMRHLEDASGAPTTPDTTSQTFRASANISSHLATTMDDVSQSYCTASTNESDGLATTPEVSIPSSFRVKPDGIVFAAVLSVEAPGTNDLAGNDPEY
jgi:hypothetical protein